MRQRPTCYLAIVGALLLAATAFGQTTKDVPDIAEREIQRRGDFVEWIGAGHRDDGQTLFSEAMRPPADDSHKWFISVVTKQGCRYCETLKDDIASSRYIKPFVNVADHTQSWAHYNVYSIEDRTQLWRWKGIKFRSFPTLIIQPPRSKQFGDPKTVVLQKAGYDGDAKKLANTIRSAIADYARKYARQRALATQRGGVGQTDVTATSQTVTDYPPPFTPPAQPAPYAPVPYTFDIPPLPQVTPQPIANPFSLLVSLLGGFLGSGGVTNFLLIALSVLAIVRTFRKATGQKLLLDDDAYQKLVDTLKQLIEPQPPNTPDSHR